MAGYYARCCSAVSVLCVLVVVVWGICGARKLNILHRLSAAPPQIFDVSVVTAVCSNALYF